MAPRTLSTRNTYRPSRQRQLTPVPLEEEANDVTNDVPEPEESTPVRRTKTVHHWAQCWLGKPVPGNSLWYDWQPEPDQIEVAVQEYGDPRWVENLFTDMIDAARDVLEESGPEFTAARLRVRLFSHRPDGTDARFTLEHIHKR
jgi:hypothetical protein